LFTPHSQVVTTKVCLEAWRHWNVPAHAALPDAKAPDREAARTIASHPEQGWSLLCNGVVIFEDTGELLPNGATIAPHRPTDPIHQAPAA